jgi:hypothetical protein
MPERKDHPTPSHISLRSCEPTLPLQGRVKSRVSREKWSQRRSDALRRRNCEPARRRMSACCGGLSRRFRSKAHTSGGRRRSVPMSWTSSAPRSVSSSSSTADITTVMKKLNVIERGKVGLKRKDIASSASGTPRYPAIPMRSSKEFISSSLDREMLKSRHLSTDDVDRLSPHPARTGCAHAGDPPPPGKVREARGRP